MTVAERAIGIGLPSTGVDDRDRFSRGISSAITRDTWPAATWGLPSRDRIFPVDGDEVLGELERVRPPSLGVRSDDGVAGCFMVDLSKLLEVNQK